MLPLDILVISDKDKKTVSKGSVSQLFHFSDFGLKSLPEIRDKMALARAH